MNSEITKLRLKLRSQLSMAKDIRSELEHEFNQELERMLARKEKELNLSMKKKLARAQ